MNKNFIKLLLIVINSSCVVTSVDAMMRRSLINYDRQLHVIPAYLSTIRQAVESYNNQIGNITRCVFDGLEREGKQQDRAVKSGGQYPTRKNASLTSKTVAKQNNPGAYERSKNYRQKQLPVNPIEVVKPSQLEQDLQEVFNQFCVIFKRQPCKPLRLEMIDDFIKQLHSVKGQLRTKDQGENDIVRSVIERFIGYTNHLKSFKPNQRNPSFSVGSCRGSETGQDFLAQQLAELGLGDDAEQEDTNELYEEDEEDQEEEQEEDL